VKASHTLNRLCPAFDDPNLVANAGLILPATLAHRLGLPELLRTIDLGPVPGRPNPDTKAMTVISALLAGAEYIDDVDVLRSGASHAVVGHRVAAPSTVGTFLRGFRWGHVRQLDAVSRELLRRAWTRGAGAGDACLTLDVDSTICETYGLHKQGGSRFTYTHVRGYHPLLATVAGSGDVVHSRLRGGNANTTRGASGFVTETIRRVRNAGSTGTIVMRFDSGFFNQGVIAACRREKVKFSITARQTAPVRRAIDSIAESAWVPIPYFLDGADVAETSYRPFGKGADVRLIVRRVRPTPGSQLEFEGFDFCYHAVVTDREGEMLELEADHRRHAEVESVIRDLKYGMGLNHLPSGRFGANGAWLGLNVIAHNLMRWVTRLGLAETLLASKTVRTRMIALPGRITRSGRRSHLHLPTNWPWAQRFSGALHRLRQLPAVQPA
jgi:Transposase DDE domain group 1